MKTLLSVVWAWAICLPVLANQLYPTSKIQSVTVYLDGAEITRTTQVELPQGRSEILLTGISPNVVPKSIRVQANKVVKLLSVNHRTNHLSDFKHHPEISKLTDSLAQKEATLLRVEGEIGLFEQEQELLASGNRASFSGSQADVASMKTRYDFYRSRMLELNGMLVQLKLEQKALQNTIANLKGQLEEWKAKVNEPSHEIRMVVSTDEPVKDAITLKYLVGGTGWAPHYDLRAERIGEPVKLDYHAKVFNNTGTAWESVKLTLSTANPHQTLVAPQVETWTINRRGGTGSEGELDNKLKVLSAEETQKDRLPDKQPKVEVAYTEIDVSDLNIAFEVKENYSLPADGKPYLVDVTRYSLPAAYAYYAVPRLDKDAFLMAKVTGWEDLNLVEGPANVYFDGTYLGESYINTRYADDTLELSLGRDPKVVLTRVKRQDQSDKRLVGLYNKETLFYEITVKNLNKAPVSIRILDQIPISQQDEVKVALIESSEAKLDELNGILTWDMQLAPSQSEQMAVGFSVRYPKDHNLTLFHSRGKIYCPKF